LVRLGFSVTDTDAPAAASPPPPTVSFESPRRGEYVSAFLRHRPRRFGIAVAVIVAVALAFRVGYVLHTQTYRPTTDAASYDGLAYQLAAGHGWAHKLFGWAYRPPGYPYFLAGVLAVTGLPHGGDRTDARIAQTIVLGVGTVVLIGLVAYELWGAMAMLIAMGIAALYLPLVVVSAAEMTESLFTPLVVGATYCAVRSRRAQHRYWWVVAAGVVAGLAALTRTNGLLVAVVLALIVWSREPGFRPRQLLAPLAVVLATALTVMPWTIRNANVLHDFVPVTVETGPTLAGTYNHAAKKRDFLWRYGGYNDYNSISNDPKLSSPELDRKLTSAVLGYMRRHPLDVPQVVFWNTVRLLDLGGRHRARVTAATDVDATAGVADAMSISFWIVAALAIVGAFTGLARRTPWTFWLLPGLLWLTTALVTTGTPRFRSALEPFVIMLAALGVIAIANRRRSAAPV
jgi:4-amino-4-deoxy-L-arabinose transferase-like glycosyltransferase